MPVQVPAVAESAEQLVPRQVEHIERGALPSQKFDEVAPLCSVLQRSAQPPADMRVVQAQAQSPSVAVDEVSLVSVCVSSVDVSVMSVAVSSVLLVSVLAVVLLPQATPSAVMPARATTPIPT
jgi:hypothetical protein